MTEVTGTALRDIPFVTADGGTATLGDYGDKVILVVNVASKCGLAPQYEQLEQLQRTYGERGFTVLGFPCNQFMGQEPGSMEEILDYCAVNWGVTFPVFDKIKVNGSKAAPLYKALKRSDKADGAKGPILWNFEKFVVSADGKHVTRFSPKIKPEDPAVIGAVEAALPH